MYDVSAQIRRRAWSGRYALWLCGRFLMVVMQGTMVLAAPVQTVTDPETGKQTTIITVTTYALPDATRTDAYSRASVASLNLFRKRFPELFAERYLERYRNHPEIYGAHPWEQVEIRLRWISIRDYPLSACSMRLKPNNRSPKPYGCRWTGSIPLIAVPPVEGMALSDWDAFIKGWECPETGLLYKPDSEHLFLVSPDFLFQDYWAERFGNVDAMNQALGTTPTSFSEARMPQQAWHYQQFLERTGSWQREFAAYNFLTVLDYLVLHGRGLINTTIYCALAVLLALLVNPMAAYAMSRYKMPSSYKLLLFMFRNVWGKERWRTFSPLCRSAATPMKTMREHPSHGVDAYAPWRVGPARPTC